MGEDYTKLDNIIDQFEKGAKEVQASSICAISIPNTDSPIVVSFCGSPRADKKTYPTLLTNIIRAMCEDDAKAVLGMLDDMKHAMEKYIKEQENK